MTLMNLVQWIDGTNNIQSVESFEKETDIMQVVADTFPGVTDDQIDLLFRYEPVLDEEQGVWIQIVSSNVK